jgi:outer membrane protein TolC
VESRRSELARAQADVAAAQAQLKLVVDPGAGTAIAVTGHPPDDGPPADLGGKLAKAQAARPEIRQQELVIDKLALDERLAQNNAQWRLDAVGGLGYNGLSGRGVNPAFPGALPSRLQGQESYTDAFRGFLTPDGNFNYSVGLRLQIPIGNNEAQGRLGQVRLQRRQEELRLMQLRSQIGVDVETAFQDMTAQAARLAASRQGVRLAREQLSGQERDLAAGLATVRQVLEAQDVLARAEDGAIQAWVDYAAARSRLDATQAQSLDNYGLVVQR